MSDSGSRGSLKRRRDVVKVILVLVFVGLCVAVLMLPAIMSPARPPGGRSPSCGNNLKQIGMAVHMYASDHNSEFPKGETAAAIMQELADGGYLSHYEVFVCPAAEADQEAWAKTKRISSMTVSYQWAAGVNEDSHPDFAVMYDKSVEHHKDGRNVLFVDGHVEWMPEDEFQERMEWQREMMGRGGNG